MHLSPFTAFHVLISLIGIASGLIVMYGFLTDRLFSTINNVFLVTTIGTSVTGFFFPFHGFTPGIGLGILSLIVLAVALWARRKSHVRTYVVSATVAEYLNVVVLIVQLFQKVPTLHMQVPIGSVPVIAAVQVLTLAVFVVICAASLRRSGVVASAAA